jgi:hypothetical protein
MLVPYVGELHAHSGTFMTRNLGFIYLACLGLLLFSLPGSTVNQDVAGSSPAPGANYFRHLGGLHRALWFHFLAPETPRSCPPRASRFQRGLLARHAKKTSGQRLSFALRCAHTCRVQLGAVWFDVSGGGPHVASGLLRAASP